MFLFFSSILPGKACPVLPALTAESLTAVMRYWGNACVSEIVPRCVLETMEVIEESSVTITLYCRALCPAGLTAMAAIKDMRGLALC